MTKNINTTGSHWIDSNGDHWSYSTQLTGHYKGHFFLMIHTIQ